MSGSTSPSTHAPVPATTAGGVPRVAYDFAVLRAVPHPHLGTFVPVGVVVHARTAEFLTLRVLSDPAVLRARVPDVDAELLARYLRAVGALPLDHRAALRRHPVLAGARGAERRSGARPRPAVRRVRGVSAAARRGRARGGRARGGQARRKSRNGRGRAARRSGA